MKLPQYDNRPGPGVPLYSDNSKSHEWQSIKFVTLGVGLPLLLFACIGLFLYELLRIFLH